MRRAISTLWLLASLSACAARHAITPDDLARHLDERLGASVPERPHQTPEVPAGVNPSDGLSMEEAVGLALWNNPDLAARLAELGLARADLLTAGKLPNPTISGLIPIDPRQWQFAVLLPIEGLWIRPTRVAGARVRGEAVGHQVIQAAVDLARDVRLSYAQSAAATARIEHLREVARLRGERRRLLARRVEVGDASPISLDVALQEELNAATAAQRGGLDERRTGTGLAQLTGFALDGVVLEPLSALLPAEDGLDLDTLTARAVASRSDLRAAQLDLEAAGHDLKTARASSVAASFGVQIQGGGANNNGLGLTPGLSVPLFDRNQDGMARARARHEVAGARLKARRLQVETEVQLAHTELMDAWETWRRMRDDALPAQRTAAERISAAHAAGDLSGVEDVEARLRLVHTHLAAIEAQQGVVTAQVQLERTLGGAITGPLVDTQNPLRAQRHP